MKSSCNPNGVLPAHRILLRRLATVLVLIAISGPAIAADRETGAPPQEKPAESEPQSLKQLLAMMGKRFGDVLSEHKIENVGVLEFINRSEAGETLTGDYGLLGLSCAAELESQLIRNRKESYGIVDRRALGDALKRSKFSVDDVGSGNALRQLASQAGRMDAIVVGRLYDRNGAIVSLRCDLIEIESHDVISSLVGAARLGESEFAALGLSYRFETHGHKRRDVEPRTAPRPIDDVAVKDIEKQVQQGNPLQDPSFPFQVRIFVNGKEREREFRGNGCFVPLRKGEKYDVRIECRTKDLAMMRLFVDGINTLPPREARNGTPPASETNPESAVIGPPVGLEDPRIWILDPNVPTRRSQKNRNVYALRGYVVQVKPQAEFENFAVVDAEGSRVGRRRFASQPGLITAAFYLADIPRRRRGEFDDPLPRITEPAALLGVVNIRYYDPDQPDKSDK